MKAAIIEVKISLEEFKGRREQVKERVGELEDRIMEFLSLRNIKKKD